MEREFEKEEGEGVVSDDGEEVEVSQDDGLDWRGSLREGLMGTGTRKAEEKSKSTEAEAEEVETEVSVAVASTSDHAEFSRFAKSSKTRDFAQLQSEVPAR